MISPEGSIVDLITPFAGDEIDEARFADFVSWQIAEGSNGLATCTTTGEGPTLTAADKERLIRICVEVSAGRVPVIAATGQNGTDATIALTRMAMTAGADAALVVTPYYNRPSQEGIFRHFEAVARAVELPIIVHNVPSRTGVDLLPATVGRLIGLPSVIGLCDQSAASASRPVAAARGRFVQLCGEDGRAAAFNLTAGQGCLSVLANLLPGACAALQRASRCGRHDLARDIGRHFAGLLDALGSDPGPAAIKSALAAVWPGIAASCRLPMLGGSHDADRAVRAALQHALADLFWLGPAVG